MTLTFTQEEIDSDHYRMLTGAESLREFFTVAASILGDLCDDVAAPGVLDVEKFLTYGSFCTWACGFQVGDTIDESWRYYWEEAASVFKIYDKLPQLTDWALREEVEVHDFFPIEIPGEYEESFDRSPIIETCFALSRWIKGGRTKMIEPDIAP